MFTPFLKTTPWLQWPPSLEEGMVVHSCCHLSLRLGSSSSQRSFPENSGFSLWYVICQRQLTPGTPRLTGGPPPNLEGQILACVDRERESLVPLPRRCVAQASRDLAASLRSAS